MDWNIVQSYRWIWSYCKCSGKLFGNDQCRKLGFLYCKHWMCSLCICLHHLYQSSHTLRIFFLRFLFFLPTLLFKTLVCLFLKFMHEIGHSFGSDHTHEKSAYSPLVDTCGMNVCPSVLPLAKSATLMSYCDLCP